MNNLPEVQQTNSGEFALDLLGDKTQPVTNPPKEGRQYDPTRDRETIRGWLAIVLLVLITIIVIASLAALVLFQTELNTIKEWLTIVFGPLTTLFGTITGFYFGEKSKENR
jgi:hypothetical protein